MRYNNQLFSRLADTNGDGTGTINAVGDYSAGGLGQTDFYIQPGAEQKFYVARLIVEIEDTTGFSATEYGNTGGALANGITIHEYDDDGEVHEFTQGEPITQNADWGRLCYDVDLKTWGVGNEILLVRFTFEKAGAGLILDGAVGGKLVIRMSDDMTGLVEHHFTVQGYIMRYDLP